MSGRKQAIIVLACTAILLISAVLILLPHDDKTPHTPISITGDSAFTESNGVISGNGSSQNPYVIEGWGIEAPSGGSGIYIRDTNVYFVVRDVDIHSDRTSHFGIYLEYVTNGTFTHIKSTGNWNGIRMYYSSSISITDCDMTSNAYGGIEISMSKNVTVSHNKAGKCNWPLDMIGSAECTIVDNGFIKGTVDVWTTDNTTFSRNVLDDCRLVLHNCTSMTVEDNIMDEPPIVLPETAVLSGYASILFGELGVCRSIM